MELSEEVEFDDNEALKDDNLKRINYKLFFIGAVAQLGERVNGIHEVGVRSPPAHHIFLYKINIIML